MTNLVIKNSEDVRLTVHTGPRNTAIEIEELGGGQWVAMILSPAERSKLSAYLNADLIKELRKTRDTYTDYVMADPNRAVPSLEQLGAFRLALSLLEDFDEQEQSE